MRNYKRSKSQRETDEEIFERGKNIEKDFDESQKISLSFSKADTKLISIRLPKWQISQLREVAQRKGDIGYQQMIKIYIAEGLLREGRGLTRTYQLGDSTGMVSNNRLNRWLQDQPEDTTLVLDNLVLGKSQEED